MSGCPVKGRGKADSDTRDSTTRTGFFHWLGYTKQHSDESSVKVASNSPIQHQSAASKDGAKVLPDDVAFDVSKSTCPVQQGAKENLVYNEKANDLVFDQSVLPGQSTQLSTRRAVSSIPNTEHKPSHQPEGVDKWVYPSEQQYFNAMKRKGYDPKEEDVAVILAIHNMVNEQGWSKIKEWEALRCCSEPKLQSFMGRPKDISPKAYFLNMMGYSLPFDRHDWIIDRHGKEVRYVIDFYTGAQTIGRRQAPVSIYLDVRPALDSPTALLDRISFSFRSYFFPQTIPRLGERSENRQQHRPK